MCVRNIIYVLSLILFLPITTYSGHYCVRDLVPDLNTPKTSYDCTCPDSRPTPFNLDSGFSRLGKCRNINKYELDIRKFAKPASNKLQLWLDAYRFSGDEYLRRTNIYDVIPVFSPNPFNGTWKNLAQDGYDFNLTRSNSYTYLQNAEVPPSASSMVGIQAMSGFPRLCLSDPHIEGTLPAFANSNTIFAVFTKYHPHNSYTFMEFTGGSNPLKITSPSSGRFRVIAGSNTYINTPESSKITSSTSATQDGINLISFVSRDSWYFEFYLNPYQQSYNQYLSPSVIGRQNYEARFPESISSNKTLRIFPDASSTPRRMALCELIVFSRDMSHGERREIEMYLRRKWAILTNKEMPSN